MIADINRLALIVQRLREDSHTVAMVTGGFDMITLDQVDMLQFAKTKADVVIAGVDSDESLTISKGITPLNPQERRLRMLDSIRFVDFVFPIREAFKFGSLESDTVHADIIAQLRPDCLITNPLMDAYYPHKLNRAKELRLSVVPFSSTPFTAASTAYMLASLPVHLNEF